MGAVAKYQYERVEIGVWRGFIGVYEKGSSYYLVHHAGNVLTATELTPSLELDATVTLAELSEPTVRSILEMGPFGEGNRRPRFATGPVELVGQPRVVGKTSAHLQLTVTDGTLAVKGIAFGAADQAEALIDAGSFRVAFEPIVNTFNGRSSVEMQVVDFQIGESGSADGESISS